MVLRKAFHEVKVRMGFFLKDEMIWWKQFFPSLTALYYLWEEQA